MTATIANAVPSATRPCDPGHLRVLRAAARAEWTKMRSVRSTMWTLLAAIGLAVGFGSLVAVTQMNSWDTLDAGERARFDPTSYSLSGLFLAQLAVGVLGVLMISSEYATGQIRATFAATPQRLSVLAGKCITFIAVVSVVGLVTSFGSFAIGQAVFAGEGVGASLGDPGVLRAVVGGALYLVAIGVLAIGIGTLVRRTAGAVTALVAVLMVLPIVTGFLPSSWNENIGKYFPARAGTAVFTVVRDANSLAPWTGFAVLVGYAVVALAAAGLLLTRRDA